VPDPDIYVRETASGQRVQRRAKTEGEESAQAGSAVREFPDRGIQSVHVDADRADGLRSWRAEGSENFKRLLTGAIGNVSTAGDSKHEFAWSWPQYTLWLKVSAGSDLATVVAPARGSETVPRSTSFSFPAAVSRHLCDFRWNSLSIPGDGLVVSGIQSASILRKHKHCCRSSRATAEADPSRSRSLTNTRNELVRSRTNGYVPRCRCPRAQNSAVVSLIVCLSRDK